MKKIALIDMDGTLFDYSKQLKEDLQKLQSPNDPELPDDVHDESLPWLKARMDLIKSVPGWWRNLPKFELGWQILDIIFDMNFDCEILTKGPRSKPHAWAEKVQCINDHFGNKINVNVVGKSKAKTYGHVLVDDYPQYVLEWLEHRPRGLVIVPAHFYNMNVNHPNIIRYDGNNKDEINEALSAVVNRVGKQHWRLTSGLNHE